MELVLFWIIMAIICGVVGNSKNRGFFPYFLGGLLLWPIVLTVAICAKPSELKHMPKTRGEDWTKEECERYDQMRKEGANHDMAATEIEQARVRAKCIEPVDAKTGAAFDLASLSNEQLERFNLLKQAGMASQEAYQEVVKMERNAT